MFKQIQKTVSIVILVAFIGTSIKSPAYAQLTDDLMLRLPIPGAMVHLSPEFTPAHLQGITIHPDNALQFDFLINKGDQGLSGEQRKDEYKKLVKYFLASLTIPDEDQWVNLSPYEKNRIIKDDFGKTEMGRDLLAQDYILKQITSSLIYPEDGLGKKFWNKVYERAWKEYHTTDIPVNTFNKVWIVPDQAIVYESGNTAYILKSHLKVMLEEDYLSLEKHTAVIARSPQGDEAISNRTTTHLIGSQVTREIILPALEKEVNEDKNFATLRQIYSGMILAAWYKKTLKESLLGKVYADKVKVKGVDQDPKSNEEIYRRYLKAFKKGVFNYIKEDVDKYTNESIPRKYFSGGFSPNLAMLTIMNLKDIDHIDPGLISGASDDVLEGKIEKARVSLYERTKAIKRHMLPTTAFIALAVGGAVNGFAQNSPVVAEAIPSIPDAPSINKPVAKEISAAFNTNEALKGFEDALRVVDESILRNNFNRYKTSLKRTEAGTIEAGETKTTPHNQYGVRTGELGMGYETSPRTFQPNSPYVAFDYNHDANGRINEKVTGGLTHINTLPLEVPGPIQPSTGITPPSNGFSGNVYALSFNLDELEYEKIMSKRRMAVSVFSGQTIWGILGTAAGAGNAEGNLGGNFIYYTSTGGRIRIFADTNYEFNPQTTYLSNSPGIHRESTSGGGDYTRYNDKRGTLLGLKLVGTLRPINDQLDLTTVFTNNKVDITSTLTALKSKNPFISNSEGAGVNVTFHPFKSRVVEFAAGVNYERRNSPGINSTVLNNGSATISLLIHTKKTSVNAGAGIIKNPPLSFDVEKSSRLADHLTGNGNDLQALILNPTYRNQVNQTDPQDAQFAANFSQWINQATSLENFVQLAKVGSADDIVKILSAMSGLADNYNYNNGKVQPVSTEHIYDAIRGAVIANQQHPGNNIQIPAVICASSGEFHAKLAEQLGQKAGIPIIAMASSGIVANDNSGKIGGHAFTITKIPGYGIVFIDWGRVVPTFTNDFPQAMKIYQAIAGIPGITHEITSTSQNGKVLAYYFTPEGKELLSKLTVLKQNEHGYSITINDYLNRADAKLRGEQVLGNTPYITEESSEETKLKWKKWLLEQEIERLKSTTSSQDHSISTPTGGIDLNSANLNLQIKRDGKGMPLSLKFQDMVKLQNIEGFVPVIIDIIPVISLPFLKELQNKVLPS